jgi:hypothetical protein
MTEPPTPSLVERVSHDDDRELCPLMRAVRKELQVLGLGVSEVDRLLRSGDLQNAEDVLGAIVAHLREKVCPSNPSTCDWVREANTGEGCDVLQDQRGAYLIPAPSATKRMSSALKELVDEAMRF